jgi:hypothetical protein
VILNIAVNALDMIAYLHLSLSLSLSLSRLRAVTTLGQTYDNRAVCIPTWSLRIIFAYYLKKRILKSRIRSDNAYCSSQRLINSHYS